ncbi:hypothetical protein N9N67_07450 [Bacteriovoracaceae bacterium]|nr:hypothetical protein [Bacteriovoracaceae bacterium]
MKTLILLITFSISTFSFSQTFELSETMKGIYEASKIIEEKIDNEINDQEAIDTTYQLRRLTILAQFLIPSKLKDLEDDQRLKALKEYKALLVKMEFFVDDLILSLKEKDFDRAFDNFMEISSVRSTAHKKFK